MPLRGHIFYTSIKKYILYFQNKYFGKYTTHLEINIKILRDLNGMIIQSELSHWKFSQNLQLSLSSIPEQVYWIISSAIVILFEWLQLKCCQYFHYKTLFSRIYKLAINVCLAIQLGSKQLCLVVFYFPFTQKRKDRHLYTTSAGK